MRITFLIVLFSILCNPGYCQHNKTKAEELTIIVTDTSGIASMRITSSYGLSGDEKKAFVKEYNNAKQKYLDKITEYYSNTYSEKEINQMLEFYTGSIGKKLLYDLKAIYSNRFPRDNSWNIQTSKLKKNIKAGSSDSLINKRVENNVAVKSNIATLISINEYLKADLENQLYDIKPQEVKMFTREYNKLAADYIKKIEDYFAVKYDSTEIQEIKDFYNLPVGKKMIKLFSEKIAVQMEADDEWSESFTEIFFNVREGKYKKK